MTSTRATFTELLNELEGASPFQAAKLARELEESVATMQQQLPSPAVAESAVKAALETSPSLAEIGRAMTRDWSEVVGRDLLRVVAEFGRSHAEGAALSAASIREAAEAASASVGDAVRENLDRLYGTPVDELVAAVRQQNELLQMLGSRITAAGAAEEDEA